MKIMDEANKTYYWVFEMSRDGTIDDDSVLRHFDIGKPNVFDLKFGNHRGGRNVYLDCRVVAHSIEVAIEIANERRVQLRASGEYDEAINI